MVFIPANLHIFYLQVLSNAHILRTFHRNAVLKTPGFILDYRTANLHYCKLFFLVCHAAKTMRTGGKKVCFRIAECSLFFMRKVLLKQGRGRFAY